MSNHTSEEVSDPVQRAVKFNVYAIALTTLWTPLNTVLLPERVDQVVPTAIRGTALGTFSLIGIGFAMIVQPLAGRISDKSPLPDRRRPFIVAGTALAVLCLGLFWLAPGYFSLLAAYILLQLGSNVAQAAFQAFIPDLFPRGLRGLASGVKNAFDELGSALGLIGTALLVGLAPRGGVALAFIAGVLILAAALTVIWVPRIGPLPPDQRASVWDILAGLPQLPAAFARDFRRHQTFARAVAARFLFLLGVYPIQRFLLYYIQERFGISGATQTTSLAALAVILVGGLAAVAAGKLSDRVGRVTLLLPSVGLAVLGIVGIAFAQSLPVIAIAGTLLALGVGAFQAVNWALLSNHLPTGYGAQYFGLANIATAGAGALAGSFGIVIDLVHALAPSATYQVAFGLAALVAMTSLLPLYRIQAT